MLGKLIKHDFHSLSRTLIPANIAILGATILATVLMTFNLRIGYNAFTDNVLLDIFQVITVVLMVVLFLAIIAAAFFIMVVIFQRFYKNFMTSEGYLTFTLPVKTSHLLWSKLITAVIWTVISSLMGILCLFIFLLFGTNSTGIISAEALKVIGTAFRQLAAVYTGGITVAIIEALFFILAYSVSFIMQVYLALVIGGAVSQKHKLLAGIGFYFLINMVTGIISTIIQVPVLNSISYNVGTQFYGSIQYSVQETINAVVAFAQPYYWLMVGFALVYSAAFFVLSHYFLKNKLNLQ